MGSSKFKQSIITGVLWKFAERMSAQIVSLAVTIILARLLMPEEYGAVSLVTIFITLANVFVTDGFGAALIQKKEADQLDFSTVFYFGLAFSSVLYMILFLMAPLIAKFYNLPILTPVLRVLAIKIPISAINSVQQAYVSRNMLFKKFFYATFIGTSISAVIGIFMAYRGFGVWALVFQYLSNTIIDTIVLCIAVKWMPSLVFSMERLKELFSYGWKILTQSLMVTLYGNLRSLVIGKVYTSADLAFYTKGSYYPNLIVANVDTAMSSALFPAMSKEQASTERVKNIARKATQLSSFLLCPLLIGFMVCAESFVIILLTEKWLPIIPYLRIICIGLLLRPAQTACVQSIKAVGRSDVLLKFDIPIRIFGILMILISVRLGVIYIAISEILVAIFGLVLYSRASKMLLQYKYTELLSDFVYNIVQSVLMGIVVYAIQFVVSAPAIIVLIVQIVVGIVSYIALSFVLRNSNLQYLLAELKQLFQKRGQIDENH